MKKFIVRSIYIVIFALVAFLLTVYINGFARVEENGVEDTFLRITKKINIEKITIDSDKDGDGILDLDDIVYGARKEAEARPRYKDAYYAGGYPPETEGVCTDVVWRAFLEAGYDLKKMVDEDIKGNVEDYPRIFRNNERPDPNIDFRRVQNLISFFKKYATELTTEIIPWDADNLKQWQGGDIVTFALPYEHIGIVSDKRRNDGVPYMIHNGGPYATESDSLLRWHQNISEITYHFRFPKQ